MRTVKVLQMDFSKAVDMVLYSRLVCEVRLHGKDIIKLERMQKRFTKILPGHAGMSSYREGWKGWDFFQESY